MEYENESENLFTKPSKKSFKKSSNLKNLIVNNLLKTMDLKM